MALAQNRRFSGALPAALVAFVCGAWAAGVFRPSTPLCLVALAGAVAAVPWRHPVCCVGAFVLAGVGIAGLTHLWTDAAVVRVPQPVRSEAIVGADADDRGRVVLRLEGRRLLAEGLGDDILLGTKLLVEGTARPLRTSAGVRAWAHQSRIAGELSVYRYKVIGPPPLATRAANAVRSRLQEISHNAFERDKSALLLGLLIGDDRDLSDATIKEFRAAGLSHLLAVSGSNLVFVVGSILVVLRYLPGGKTMRTLAAVVVTCLYVIVTRGEPSVLRAAVMAHVAFASSWVGIVRDPPRAFAAAVLGLGICDPLLLSSVGFQLSAAATAGIVAWSSPIEQRLTARIPSGLAKAIALTTSAQVAVSPLLIWHFGGTSLAGFLVNIPAVPLAGFLTVAGAVAGLLQALGISILWLLDAPLGWLGWLGHMGASLPLGRLVMERWAVVAGMVMAGAIFLALRGRPRIMAGGVALVVIMTSGFVASAAERWGVPLCAGLAVLDVGQGDATLLRGDRGATVLIDTGANENVLLPMLRRHGVDHLDLLVLTHIHADHVGAVPELLLKVPVGHVATGPRFDPDSGKGTAAAEAIARHGRRRIVTRGDQLVVDDIGLDVLWPPSAQAVSSEPNEDSVVLAVTVGSVRAILLADASASVQRFLGHPEPVDVVKVAHQGARDQEAAFYGDLQSELAVIPVGPNSYGHPAPETISMLGEHSGRVLRTDRDQTVVVCADANPAFVQQVHYAGGP